MANQPQQTHPRIPRELHTRLKVVCARCRLTMQSVITAAVTEWLERHELAITEETSNGEESSGDDRSDRSGDG
jgi:hypothetical protein